MDITVDMIKGLREKTGAGMMDCKKALTECGGDLEKATVWLPGGDASFWTSFAYLRSHPMRRS